MTIDEKRGLMMQHAHDIIHNAESDLFLAVRRDNVSAVRAILDDVREDVDALIVEWDTTDG
jgi:hypothetical protein